MERQLTHIVVTLRDGRQVTYHRADVTRIQYFNEKSSGTQGDQSQGTWNGTWTRWGNSNTFDAYWKNTNGRYTGKLSADRTRVTGGTATFYAPGTIWTTTISP